MSSGDQAANKDIIYIDVDDDVTSVIGKLRESSEKIVALVPPKSTGALQSAVNLRLLTRAADGAGKRIVLITNNSGLTALAAAAKIPVAKNLQSKPEIPAAPAKPADPGDEIIKGDELPVGELAAVSLGAEAVEAAEPLPAVASTAIAPRDDDMTITDLPDLDHETPELIAAGGAAKKAAKKGPRVPDFGRFRKWIFIGGGLVVAIILFIVLTNVFFTHASVVIAAQSSDVPVSQSLTLTTDGATNPDQATIKAVTKQLKKTASVDFTATGSKNVGDKATGTVKFSTNNISNLGTTIPAGTELTAGGGSAYTTDQAVTIGFTNYNDAETGITAESQGSSSNGATGSLSGAPDGISATVAGSTSGGTDKTVTVVSAGDIQAATAKLGTSSADEAKAALQGQFGSDYVVIGDSFSATDGQVVSTPAQDAQATSAKLTRDSTYSLTAISRDEIKAITTDYLSGKITGDSQKIYDDGSKDATLSQFATSPSGVETIRLTATGKVGPNIDENALKGQLVGKKSGEIISQVKAIDGVRDVTVHLSPFWRTTAPSADKISISFELSNGN